MYYPENLLVALGQCRNLDSSNVQSDYYLKHSKNRISGKVDGIFLKFLEFSKKNLALAIE